jgi:hypothetical protein
MYSTSIEPQKNPVVDCAAGSNGHHHLSRDDPDRDREVEQNNVGDGELAGGGVHEQRVRHEGQERERKP